MNNFQIEFAPNRTGNLSDDIHKANPFTLTREFDPIGFPNSNIFVEQGNVHLVYLSASHTITGSDSITWDVPSLLSTKKYLFTFS